MPIITRNPAKASLRDSKSKKCRSKTPLFCRYHGVPQPISQTEARKNAETASQDLTTQHPGIYLDAKIKADENFKRYIAGGEYDGFPNFEKAKPLMAKIYSPSEVNEENFKRMQNDAWADRQEKFEAYKNTLAAKLFQGDKDAIFIAQNGTKEKFTLDNARKHKWPSCFVGEGDSRKDEEKVQAYANKHNLHTATVATDDYYHVFTVVDPNAYPVSSFREAQLVQDPEFSKKVFAYREVTNRVWGGQDGAADIILPFKTINSAYELGRMF